MTQPTAEQLEVTQADVTAALPTESELKLARECTARANFLLEEKTLQSILNGEQDTWPEIVASILAIRATEARIAAAVEAERERCMMVAPCTAQDPNTNEYDRGYFDGIMEYQAAIRSLQ